MFALRLLFVLLVVLNLAASAAIGGWLDVPDGTRGEPERLANQLHPERIRLGSPGTAAAPEEHPAPAVTPPPATENSAGAPAAAPQPAPAPEPAPGGAPPPSLPASPTAQPRAAAAVACVALANLSADEADRIARGVTDRTVTVERAPLAAPTAWWVRIPPADSREAAEQRMTELRAQGVKDMFIVHEGTDRYAISLGIFKGEAAARQQLGELEAKGVRGAEVAPRISGTTRVQLRGPADAVARVARRLAARLPSAERGDCAS